MKHYILIIVSVVCSLTLFAEPLPRIDLHYSLLASDTFNVGSFRFVDGKDTISLDIKIRHRGASSLKYDKPSYAIKIIDSIGNSVDTSFLSMRNDNYWILDAMASDKARMRNRVSMDLWLAFSRKPWYADSEPKMVNGYRGEMVEVYVNDLPYGIYCLMERVDRKQLKLKKYSEKKGIQGILYKSNSWAGTANFGEPTTIPTNNSDTWDSWEVQYPDYEDGEPISWDRLYHLIHFVRNAEANTFIDSIACYLDMPVFIDYVLFCQLLSARDNTAKNIHLSFYNSNSSVALFTPWDLDHSWGRQYNSKTESTTENLFVSNTLTKRLDEFYHLQDTLELRYAELRNHYFTIEYIDALFAPYFERFAQTGLDTIEQKLWSGHDGITFDIASEQAYIHQWVVARLNFLDNLYHYQTTPSPNNICQPVTSSINQSTTKKYVIHDQLYIQHGEYIYDNMGHRIQ